MQFREYPGFRGLAFWFWEAVLALGRSFRALLLGFAQLVRQELLALLSSLQIAACLVAGPRDAPPAALPPPPSAMRPHLGFRV